VNNSIFVVFNLSVWTFFCFERLYNKTLRDFFLWLNLEGSMPLRKKKVYSRFCVGTMMKARKTARKQIAAAHKSVAALKKNVESLMAKRRRLEAKVIHQFLIEIFLCVQLDLK